MILLLRISLDRRLFSIPQLLRSLFTEKKHTKNKQKTQLFLSRMYMPPTAYTYDLHYPRIKVTSTKIPREISR